MFQVMPPRGGIPAPPPPPYRWQRVSSHAPARGHHGYTGSIVVKLYVSSHAPVRGHRALPGTSSGTMCFKSCPREGASAYRRPDQIVVIRFKSCPREGASSDHLTWKRPSIRVSSHAPVRGHLSFLICLNCNSSSFKSCPREGASQQRSKYTRDCTVSSHAPVRGHQLAGTITCQFSPVSSHAPVRGHPYKNSSEMRAPYSFQVMPP